MNQDQHLSHADYCRMIGQLYIDSCLRIETLEKAASNISSLAVTTALQNQIKQLQLENKKLREGAVDGSVAT